MKIRRNSLKKRLNVSHETFFVPNGIILFIICLVALSAAINFTGVRIVCRITAGDETICSTECADAKGVIESGVKNAANKYGISPSEKDRLRERFDVKYRIAFGEDFDGRDAVDAVSRVCEKTEVTAYSLYIDGEYIGSCGSKSEIFGAKEKTEKVFEKLTAAIESEGGDSDSLSEGWGDSEIIRENVRADRLITGEELEELLGYGRAERELALITEYAGAVDLKVNDFGDAEFESEAEIFSPPLKMSSRSGEEFIEVAHEVIPHGTEYVYTDELSVGTQRLRKRGKDGSARTAYLVSTVDGEYIRTEIDSEIICEPTDNVVYMGAYRRGGKGDRHGRFICPCVGTVSSGFGQRELFGESEVHGGLDIAAGEGTEIVCAEEGTVEFAGDCGNGYGIHVIVSHGDGMSTLYAHMRAVSVKVGDTVLQGQKLGEVGLTGKTTGFHLHFEIRKDGARVNPLDFITVNAGA